MRQSTERGLPHGGESSPYCSVLASGLLTAVGFNAPSSLAAIRAKISGIRESHLYDRETGESLLAGKVDLPQWWESTGKLAELIAPCIVECLASRPVAAEKVPVLIGTAPVSSPRFSKAMADELLNEVRHRLPFVLHPSSQLIPSGQVSVARGIQLASAMLSKGEASLCVVGGVDSFLRQAIVDAYRTSRRLMTAKNSNGFLPGEAGSAILLGSSSLATGPRLDVLGLGSSIERSPITSEEPFRAEGMTSAIQSALDDANLVLAGVDYRITDLNGEHYKFKEAAFPVGRLLKAPKPDGLDVWHPIECLGEIGAAIGPCVLALALHAGSKAYSPGSMVLCHFSNDDGERAAIVVRFVSGGMDRRG